MARSDRRAFLSGRSAIREVEAAGEKLVDAILDDAATAPSAGDTIRLETRAMACSWQVVLNPGQRSAVMHASDALDLVHHLESLMTVYREDGQLSIVNREAASGPVEIDAELTAILKRAFELTEATGGAFDVTSGPLVRVWRSCRDAGRVPTEDELAEAHSRTGVSHIELDEVKNTVRFATEGVELNLGAIGKGYALDRAAEFLLQQGIDDFLIHGGASSVLARGSHTGQGWPVGIKNPLLNEQRMVTLVLGDVDNSAGRALGTSGGNVQFFRLGGKRYGHILDPRSGQPAERLLSASIVAADAATADALSTAAFVAGPGETGLWCERGLCSGAVLTPLTSSRNVQPEVCQLAEESLFFEHQ